AEDGIRERNVTGVQTCALPIYPAANIVAGFPPSMVPYDFLSDSEINSLIEYIKSLSDAAPPESDTQAEEAESESTEEAENETQSTRSEERRVGKEESSRRST